MSQKITRREFSARAVAAAAASALLTNRGTSQDTKGDQGPHPDIPQLNKQLAKPVPGDLIKGVSDGLKHNDDLNKTRLKHRLQEGSEPDMIYVPKGAKR